MALSRPLVSRLIHNRLSWTRSSSSSSFLINDSKYQFLQDLGLKENNSGVFDGSWKGSGEVSGDWRELLDMYDVRASPPITRPMVNPSPRW